jgi:hypothetical protein
MKMTRQAIVTVSIGLPPEWIDKVFLYTAVQNDPPLWRLSARPLRRKASGTENKKDAKCPSDLTYAPLHLSFSFVLLSGLSFVSGFLSNMVY